MNQVSLVGRLTRDPELQYIGGETPMVRFTLAVDRNYRDKNNEKVTDFIPVQAWNGLAELVGKYLSKGRLVGVAGRLQIDRVEQEDGSYRSYTKVVADTIDFLSSKPVGSGDEDEVEEDEAAEDVAEEAEEPEDADEEPEPEPAPAPKWPPFKSRNTVAAGRNGKASRKF